MYVSPDQNDSDLFPVSGVLQSLIIVLIYQQENISTRQVKPECKGRRPEIIRTDDWGLAPASQRSRVELPPKDDNICLSV